MRWGLDVFTHAQGPGSASIEAGLEAGLVARLHKYWRRVARCVVAMRAQTARKSHALPRSLKRIHDGTAALGGVWLGGEPEKPEVVRSTGTLVLPKGWHKWKQSDMAALMSIADVIVVNYALHYHGEPGKPETKLPQYEGEMSGLFAQLEAFGRQPGKAAVFRETGAQHFTGTGAYAGDDQAHPGKARGCHCGAMAPEVLRDNEVTRFNDVIHRLAATCVAWRGGGGAPHDRTHTHASADVAHRQAPARARAAVLRPDGAAARPARGPLLRL